MGVVYLAWRADNQFRKQVAIKLLQGSMMSEQILKRFRFERQILANLEHPNIARLLDGGATEQGEPYIVMEYVRGGIPIDRYCEEQGLHLEQRLRLFQTVCSAVQYAHQHLIVHRDLKPGNILVTTDGQVKLLDFGIAKALIPVFGPDEVAHTKTGMMAMTPEYASPEQIRGEPIGVASDVYTLGVVLYQLLTGSLPFRTRTGGMPELMKEVCELEPRKPSTAVANRARFASSDMDEEPCLSQIEGPDKLARKLSGDVDNIVLMAMRKESTRRYASVEQLHEDIRRYLDGMPVMARPATALYRAEKFIRRHAALTAAGVLLLVSLVGGMIATARMAHRAEEQRSIAQTQAAEAERQRRLAQQNAADAKAQAEEAQKERRKADQRFDDVRKLASSLIFDVDGEVVRLAGSTSARKLIVQKGQQYLELLSREREDDKELGEELAYAHTAIGLIQRARNRPNLGDTEGSRASYMKALEVAARVQARHGDSAPLMRARSSAHSGLGDLQLLEGNLDAARKHFEVGLKLAEQVAFLAPQNRDAQRYALGFYGKLAEIVRAGEESDKAEKYLVRAREWCGRALKAHPDDPTAMRDRIVSNSHLAQHYRKERRWQEALRILEGSIPLLDALLKRPETEARIRRDVMVNHASMGECWRNLGSYEKALEHNQKELEFCLRQHRDDPKNVLSHYDLSAAEDHVATDLTRLGRHAEALPHAEASLKAAESAAAIDPRSTMTLHHTNSSLSVLSETLRALGRWPEASKSVLRMVEITEEAHRRQANEETSRQLARRYTQAGDHFRNAAFVAERDQQLAQSHRFYKLAAQLYRDIDDPDELEWVARKLNGLPPGIESSARQELR